MPEPSPCEAALSRLSDLIAGALDEAEAAQVDRHLTECEACYRSAVAFFNQDRTYAQMSSRSRLTDASSRFHQALRAEVSRGRRRRLVVFGSLAAAAMVAAVFFVVRSGSAPEVVLELAQGEVYLVEDSSSRAAASGDAIRSGLGLETRGAGSRAVIRFTDRTKLELSGQTTVRDIRAAISSAGKRLFVARGAVVAEVAPQPEGRPMILLTSSGEAQVLGTTLRLSVDDEMPQSRLEVQEGKVRLTRLLDRKSVDVPSGHFAVAASGIELSVKPLTSKGAPSDLLQMDYAPLRSLLRLKSKTWAALPWTATITDAREAAAREKKPIFMMVGDGHPLGWIGANGVTVREGVLSDPKVANLLREKFVLVAIDAHSIPNLTSAERSWLQGFPSGIEASTMGLSVFTPEGKKLVAAGPYDPRSVQEMLESALRSFRASAEPLPPLDRQGVESIGRPPAGGLALYVSWKAFYDGPEANATIKDERQVKLFQDALGSDRLWVRKDEVEALAQERFPDSLKSRMILCHFNRLLSPGVRQLSLTVEGGRIRGWAQTAPGEGISFQGLLEVKEGTIVRFELLARGTAVHADEFGFTASLAVIPKGRKVPVALFFELAPPEPLSRVAPRLSRDPNYLR